MPVIIETAGSHDFDLRHIRQQGGDELLQLLLEKAGLPPHLLWRLQVQKKLNCNAETPPVRVVDEPKKWAVHLKIKPGDNNSCHYCSLLMPDGLCGQSVYYSLGRASAEFDRNWRYKTVEPSNGAHPDRFAELFGNAPDAAASPEPDKHTEEERPAASVEPAPPPAGETPAESGNTEAADTKSSRVRGWLSDADKTRLLLLAIHEINAEGTYSQDHWVELLCQRMDWGGANRHEIGGVLTSLVRKDLVERRFRGSKPYGYLLSEQGERLIADLIQSAPAAVQAPPVIRRDVPPVPAVAAPAVAAPAVAAPAVAAPAAAALAAAAPRTANDPAEIIRSFGPVAKQFLDADARLKEIGRREEELSAELESLRQERERICRLFEDNQIQNVLATLTRLVLKE